MDNQLAEGDRLFLIAESLAQDFSLFPSSGATGIEHHVRGLLSRAQIARQLELLNNLDIDSYIESVVAKAEDPGRIDAPTIIRQLGGQVHDERIDGPFYSAMVEMDFDGESRTVAFIAQDRSCATACGVPSITWPPRSSSASARSATSRSSA